MSKMQKHEAGRGFAFRVVVCVIIAVAFCYGLFRFGERTQSDSTRNGASQTVISTTNSNRLPLSGSPAVPTKDATTAPDHLVEQAAEPRTRSTKKLTDVIAPPPSITFETNPEQQREFEAGVSAGKLKERSKNFTAHVDSRGCKECRNSQSGGLAIPKGCEYSAYTITQRHREPNTPIEQSDKYTSYSDGLQFDANGRVVGVRMSVGVNGVDSSTVVPSITMQLTVVAMCPSDLDIDGWPELNRGA